MSRQIGTITVTSTCRRVIPVFDTDWDWDWAQEEPNDADMTHLASRRGGRTEFFDDEYEFSRTENVDSPTGGNEHMSNEQTRRQFSNGEGLTNLVRHTYTTEMLHNARFKSTIDVALSGGTDGDVLALLVGGLAAACRGEDEIRQELVKLIQRHGNGRGIL